jgi:transposase
MTRIEVVTSVQRRRRWSREEKYLIVKETYEPGTNVSLVARKHGISPSQLFQWRRRMEEGALTGIDNEESLVPKSEVKALEKRIRELERMLGKMTLQNEILKEGIRIGREKKLISRQPLQGLEDFE